MNQGSDGVAIVKSTTPGAVFDVFSIDLGSGARSEFVDVTVVALDADGFEIKSVTFNSQERLAEHALDGFVNMASLEITSVLSNDITNAHRFSFDNIHITPSILADTYSCLGFDSPMGNGPVNVKKNRALPNKGALVDTDGILITDQDIDSPPVIMVDYYSNDSAEGVDVTREQAASGSGFAPHEHGHGPEGRVDCAEQPVQLVPAEPASEARRKGFAPASLGEGSRRADATE